MSDEDFYEILGVSKDASEEEIKQAYREKATEYHPDVSDDPNAEEKFKKLQKAKEILTDEEKRTAYDRLGHERFVEAEKRGGFDQGAGRGGGGRRQAGGDPFGGQGPFGSVEDIFDEFFGGGGSRSRGGRDLRTEITIDLETAYHGSERELTITRPERCSACNGQGHAPGSSSRTCPECNGRGQVQQVQRTPLGRVQQTQVCPRCEGDGSLYEDSCTTCGGDGIVQEEVTLTVDIPAGIQDGQTLRMEGEGAPAETGRRRGDLLIDVTVTEHDTFERDDADLYYQTAISFPQAVFGDTIRVPTFDGDVELDIPAGTQSGEQFRLRGKGMPHIRRRSSGDLFVTVQVVTPDPGDLTEDQQEALEAFAAAGGEDIEVDQSFFDRLRSSL